MLLFYIFPAVCLLLINLPLYNYCFAFVYFIVCSRKLLLSVSLQYSTTDLVRSIHRRYCCDLDIASPGATYHLSTAANLSHPNTSVPSTPSLPLPPPHRTHYSCPSAAVQSSRPLYAFRIYSSDLSDPGVLHFHQTLHFHLFNASTCLHT